MKTVVVAGGANLDMNGRPFQPLVPKVSNPGCIEAVFGGVARNIACNLARLGLGTHLITAFGGDANAVEMEKSCREAGIRTEASGHFPDSPSPGFLSVENECGEMQVAVADLRLYDRLDAAFFQDRIEVIRQSDALVVDTNLSTQALLYIAHNARVPIFIDPVSAPRSVRAMPILPFLAGIKPNRYEAERITGMSVQTPQQGLAAAQQMVRMGARRVFLTLGGAGVAVADASEAFVLRVPPVRVVRDTGAGDAFMAGVVHAFLQGASLMEMAVCGATLSALSLSCAETVAPQLSVETLEAERLKTQDQYSKEEFKDVR